MEENISVKVDGLEFFGQLKYKNSEKSEIFLTLPKDKSHFFKKLYDNPEAFNINGKLENDSEFTAFDCYVVQASLPTSGSLVNDLKAFIDFHSNIESNTLIKYKIEIGKLYLNGSDVNDKINIKKIAVLFSSIEQWIPHNENKKIFIKHNNCHIVISNHLILIELSEVVPLKQLNQILFDLRVFFEVLVLNNDVKTIEKFIYTVDNKKIEEVMHYKSKQTTKEKFLFRYDANSIENILNCWFETKGKYGKIFDYLSGILNESSIVHLELKYFALAQWMEAYSREFLNNKTQKIIIENIKNDDEKKLLLSQFQNDSFRKNLREIFRYKELKIILGITNSKKQGDFIDQIICYRNHLTHINVKDELNNTKMLNLYEILKDMIYILLMKELNVTIDDNRLAEIKRKYMQYVNLKKHPCEEWH